MSITNIGSNNFVNRILQEEDKKRETLKAQTGIITAEDLVEASPVGINQQGKRNYYDPDSVAVDAEGVPVAQAQRMTGAEGLMDLGSASSKAYQFHATRADKRIGETRERVRELVKLDPTNPLALLVTALGAREEILTNQELSQIRNSYGKKEQLTKIKEKFLADIKSAGQTKAFERMVNRDYGGDTDAAIMDLHNKKHKLAKEYSKAYPADADDYAKIAETHAGLLEDLANIKNGMSDPSGKKRVENSILYLEQWMDRQDALRRGEKVPEMSAKELDEHLKRSAKIRKDIATDRKKMSDRHQEILEDPSKMTKEEELKYRARLNKLNLYKKSSQPPSRKEMEEMAELELLLKGRGDKMSVVAKDLEKKPVDEGLASIRAESKKHHGEFLNQTSGTWDIFQDNPDPEDQFTIDGARPSQIERNIKWQHNNIRQFDNESDPSGVKRKIATGVATKEDWDLLKKLMESNKESFEIDESWFEEGEDKELTQNVPKIKEASDVMMVDGLNRRDKIVGDGVVPPPGFAYEGIGDKPKEAIPTDRTDVLSGLTPADQIDMSGTDATDSFVTPPSYANPETIARFQQEKKEAQNRLLENSIREAANREPEPSYLAKANDYINSIIGKVDMEGGLVPPLALVEGVLPDTSSVGKLKDSIVNKGTQLKTKLKSLYNQMLPFYPDSPAELDSEYFRTGEYLADPASPLPPKKMPSKLVTRYKRIMKEVDDYVTSAKEWGKGLLPRPDMIQATKGGVQSERDNRVHYEGEPKVEVDDTYDTDSASSMFDSQLAEDVRGVIEPSDIIYKGVNVSKVLRNTEQKVWDVDQETDEEIKFLASVENSELDPNKIGFKLKPKIDQKTGKKVKKKMKNGKERVVMVHDTDKNGNKIAQSFGLMQLTIKTAFATDYGKDLLEKEKVAPDDEEAKIQLLFDPKHNAAISKEFKNTLTKLIRSKVKKHNLKWSDKDIKLATIAAYNWNGESIGGVIDKTKAKSFQKMIEKWDARGDKFVPDETKSQIRRYREMKGW